MTFTSGVQGESVGWKRGCHFGAGLLGDGTSLSAVELVGISSKILINLNHFPQIQPCMCTMNRRFHLPPPLLNLNPVCSHSWNPAFVMSADHPSWVTETFPGAGKCWLSYKAQDPDYSQLSLLLAMLCVWQIHHEKSLDAVGMWKVGHGGFRPHCDQGISKRSIISQSKWLQVHCDQILAITMEIKDLLDGW